MPQAMAKESSEEWSQDMAADGIGTTAHKDANVHGHGAGDDATKIKVSRSCNGCENAGKPLTETGKKRLVNRLLGLAETQATQGSFKITPADLIRLMQLHKEMNPQKDRKVIVQWIEDRPE